MLVAMSVSAASDWVLGIETSCDETAAALLVANGDGTARIAGNVIASQLKTHTRHGGVVPELAARQHLASIDRVIGETLAEGNITPKQLTAIAATGGPGLIGGVLVGSMVAKGMASMLGIPYFAINHLEGHALTIRLTQRLAFPFLLLLVSGGHSQLLAVKGVGDYALYGTTLDDAAGEAFDKSAKLLGLPLPGGPSIEKMAEGGDASAFVLPRPLALRKGCDFSFSGLKTAVMMAWQKSKKTDQARRDLAASIQAAIADCLVSRTTNGMRLFAKHSPQGTKPCLVASGGVAANKVIRAALTEAAMAEGFAFHAPPLNLCTDNGVMIAWAGIERMAAGLPPSAMDFAPRPRWPLTSLQEEATSHAIPA